MTNFDVILKNDFIKDFVREKFGEKTGKIVLQIFITNKKKLGETELIPIPGTDYSIYLTNFKKQNKIGRDKADTSKVFGFQILDYDDYTAVDCYVNTPEYYYGKMLGKY